MTTPHPGAMIALYPSPELAAELALEGGETADDLHVTLAYFGDAAELSEEQVTTIHRVVSEWAGQYAPISGSISGYGVFKEGENDVTYASLDIPGLEKARTALVDALTDAGVAPHNNHGFTPHITLQYGEITDLDIPVGATEFSEVAVVVSGNRNDFTLEGPGALTAAGQNAVVDALGRVWKPWLHPRDHRGRFIHTAGSVKFRLKKGGSFDDASGRVERINPDGSILVRIDEALSPDARQRFSKGDLVAVPKSEIEVLDAKARIKKNGRVRKMNAGQRARLLKNVEALRAAVDPKTRRPSPTALAAADKLEQGVAEADKIKGLLAKRAPQQQITDQAAKASDLFEEAADLLDQGRGAGHEDGEQMARGQADALATLFDNAFSATTTVQGFIEGAHKGRLQAAGAAKGRGQQREDFPGDVNLPGEETGVNVYKDIDGNVLPDPIVSERERIKADRAQTGEPDLTDEEIVNQFISNDGLVEPRLVNGLDRQAPVFRRGLDAVAGRRFVDRDGSTIVPGSIVSVDAGTGKGGGFVREAFVGLTMRVMDEDGKLSAVVRDFRPEFKGMSKEDHEAYIATLPEDERENERKRPKDYFEKGWATYTRLPSGALQDVSPDTTANFAALMGQLKGEYGAALDRMSKAMVELGAERRFAGGKAGRLSELVRNEGIAMTLRRKVDANGRIVQVGDWVFVPSAGGFGQVVSMEPNTNTLSIEMDNLAGGPIRKASTRVAFAHGATSAVFGRDDLDALSGAGIYAPTKAEASEVARRLGLPEIADAIESGSGIREAFESSDRWALIATNAVNVRGRLQDRAQRGLSISDEDSRLLQDSAILGAALTGVMRDDADGTPERKIEVPEAPAKADVPPVPNEMLPEGLNIPEGAQVILNPDNENSVFLKNSDGSTTEWSRDPATGEWIDEGAPSIEGPPEGPIETIGDVPEGFERRTNGAGKKDSFFTPDGRFKVQENRRGELVVTDLSDIDEPDVVGTVADWDEVVDLIDEINPDSVPDADTSIEEIYTEREDAALDRIGEALGKDVADLSVPEIMETPEFQEAIQTDKYGQIAFDFNEIAAAEEVQAAPDEVRTPPTPEPAPEVTPEPEPVDAVDEAPANAADAEEIGRNMVDTLGNLITRFSKDPRISKKVVNDVEDQVAIMDDALDAGDMDAFFAAAEQIVRNPGVPEPVRRGLAQELATIKRNGGGTAGEAKPQDTGLADQLAPIDFDPITPADGSDPDAVRFLETYLENFGDYLAARFEKERREKGWTLEAQQERNKDRIAGAKEMHKNLKKALENPDLTPEDRQAAIDAALTRMLNQVKAGDQQNKDAIAGQIQNLIDRNKAGYNLQDVNAENVGEDVADAVWEDNWYATVSDIEGGPGNYKVLDGNGEPVNTGYVAEYPASRLAIGEGDITREEFDEYWENVVSSFIEDDESAAIFITTDEDGNTVLSVGSWSDTEDFPAEIAAANGDAYFDGEQQGWITPEPTVDETPASADAERALYDTLSDAEKSMSRDEIESLTNEYNQMNLAVEDIKATTTVEELDAILEDYSGPDIGYGVDEAFADFVESRRAELTAPEADAPAEDAPALASITPDQVDDVITNIRDKEGYTIDLSTGQDEFTTGFSVSLPGLEETYPKETIVEGGDGRDIVNEFVDKNSEALGRENHNFGSWVEGGDVFLDVSEVIDDVVEAMRVGREREQIAIFDFARGASVYLNDDGTGTVKDFDGNVLGTYDAEGNFNGTDSDPQAPGGGDDGGLPPEGGGGPGGGGAPDNDGRGGPDGGVAFSAETLEDFIPADIRDELADIPDPELPEPEADAPQFSEVRAVDGSFTPAEYAKRGRQYLDDAGGVRELFTRVWGENPAESRGLLAAYVADNAVELATYYDNYLRPRPDEAGSYASAIVIHRLFGLTDEDRAGEVGKALEEELRGLYGLLEEPTNPISEEDRALLLEARSVASARLGANRNVSNYGQAQNDQNLIDALDKALAFGDLDQDITWAALNRAQAAPGRGTRQIEAIDAAYESTIRQANPKIYRHSGSAAVPELGLPETPEGEISLASISKDLFSDRNFNFRTGDKLPKEAFVTEGGISVVPMGDEQATGINGSRTYIVRPLGSKDKFVLKYDNISNAYAEVIVPRLVAAAGGRTPTVTQLAPINDDHAGYVGFLQTWAGADTDFEILGQAQYSSGNDAIGDVREMWAAGVDDPDGAGVEVARESLRMVVSNFVGWRKDEHGGNYIVGRENGAPRMFGIDNGFAMDSDYTSRSARSVVIDKATGNAYGSYLTWWLANPNVSQENKDAVLSDLEEWIQSLHSYLEENAGRALEEGGLKTPNFSRTRALGARDWLETLTVTTASDIWEVLTTMSNPDPYNIDRDGDGAFEDYRFFALRIAKEATL